MESAARPGGTITGLDFYLASKLTAKRLQLLKEAIPALTHVGVLFNPKYGADDLSDAEQAAPKLGLVLHTFPVQSIEELKPALSVSNPWASKA